MAEPSCPASVATHAVPIAEHGSDIGAPMS
jgi:hypothetical protein